MVEGLKADRSGAVPDDDPSPEAGGETFLPETEQPAPPVLPRLGPGGWARWAWRQLTSMRVALLLLLLLAVAALPGSVFPQRRIDRARVDSYLDTHPASGPWLDRLGLFDVYTSPWFSAIYLLLFVSLVGCVLPRARRHWLDVRSAPPRTPRRLERLPEFATTTATASGDDVLAAAKKTLKARRYRVAEYDGGTSLAAEKGYLAETGNIVFHLSLLGLLAAVGYGSFTGYTGQAILVEGNTWSNSVPMYDTFSASGRVDPEDLTPFSFTLDSMKVKFEVESRSAMGAARAFDAHVTVKTSPGAAPEPRLVQVNHPLRVGSTKVYLAANGYAPIVTVRDGSGAVVFSGPVPSLSTDANYTSTIVVKVPDATPRQLAFVGTFLPWAKLMPGAGWVSIFPDAVDPRLVLTAFAADPGEDGLGMNSGVPQSVYTLDVKNLTQLTTTDGEQVRLLLAPGQTEQLPGGAGSITFEGLRRWAGLDVHSDPSRGWALAASLLAFAGVTASLFVRRRRVWVRVTTGEGDQGPTTVEVAGLARGEDAGLAAEVKAVLEGAAGQKE
jgi:cytochrome c biogenesis protein